MPGLSAKKEKTVPFTLRVSPELRARLEREAQQDHRSAGMIGSMAIDCYLKAKQNRRKMIELALSDADTCTFVSEQEMTKWVESL